MHLSFANRERWGRPMAAIVPLHQAKTDKLGNVELKKVSLLSWLQARLARHWDRFIKKLGEERFDIRRWVGAEDRAPDALGLDCQIDQVSG